LEVGEVLDGADLPDARGDVVGDGRELTAGRLVTLLLERLAGDAHLHVVGLAREDEQRFVLRLPAEPGDRAVVAAPIDAPADTEIPLGERVGGQVGHDRAVADLLDEAGAEDGCGNPEDDVVVPDLSLEVLLRDGAAGRLRVSGDDE
jgi:hypothetical protein